MELRKKFNMPGKHPGCKRCPNLGTDKCRCKDNLHKCDGSCNPNNNAPANSNDALVAEITKKVLASLGK